VSERAQASRRLTWLVAVGLVVLLAACAQAPKPLYHWEGYQRGVYEFLKGDGISVDEQLTQMLAQAEKARGRDVALPPGFRAHLGLLQLQAGRVDEARSSFVAEKTAFPEASHYMDFLLAKMGAAKS
jgi:hypothetical protein